MTKISKKFDPPPLTRVLIESTFVLHFRSMIRPIGIFLLSLFMYSQVYNTSVWVNYELNIEEITEMFCENTDKPELNCHGSCHLKKQLIHTNENSPLESERNLYINEIQLFPNSNTELEIVELSDIAITPPARFQDTYKYLMGLGIFHPPQTV